MTATLSILGLYNYDSSIFDNFKVPSNFESGARDDIIENILIETGELECLYTDPDFLKYAIGVWSNKYQLEWQELRETQLYEYNPIWNADYSITDNTLETRDLAGTDNTTEQFTRNLTEDFAKDTETEFTRNLNENFNRNLTEGFTRNLGENRSGESESETEIKNHVTSKSGDDTTTNSVYSYNNNTDSQPRDKSKVDYGSRETENGKSTTDGTWSDSTAQTGTTSTTQTGTTTTTQTGTTDTEETGTTKTIQTGGTTNRTDNDTTDTGTIDTAYTRYLCGNYGQTTTQRMIEEQRALVKFNLYNYIIEQFKQRFCVLVY